MITKSNTALAYRSLTLVCPCQLAVSSIRIAPDFALGPAAGGIFFHGF